MALTPWAPAERAIGRNAERLSGWEAREGVLSCANDMNQLSQEWYLNVLICIKADFPGVRHSAGQHLRNIQ